MNGMGRADLNLKSSVLALALLLPSIPIAMHYGVLGLSIMWLIVEPVITFATVTMSKKAVTFSMSKTARNLLPALVSSAAMAAGVFLVKWNAGLSVGPIELLWEVSVGGGMYVLTLWFFFRPQFTNATNLLLGRRNPSPE
jgi:hypothetical protein